MSAKLNYAIILLLLASLSACSSSEEKDQFTQVRFFNSTNAPLQIDLQPEKTGNADQSFKLGSSEKTDYSELTPDRYELNISTEKQKLLSGKKGLARGEKYTVIVYGKPDYSTKVNQSDFKHKLHYIVEGAENYSRNAYLPSEMVFSDKAKLKKGISNVRAFHSAAGIGPVTIKIKSDEKSRSLAKGLAYAKPNLGKHFKAGKKTIEVYFKGGKKPFITKDYEFRSEKSYLIILHMKGADREISIFEN